MSETIYLSVREIAKRLHVHPQTIRRWYRDEGLPLHYVSTQRGYGDWDEVQAWLKQKRAAPGRAPAPITIVAGDTVITSNT